MAQENNMYLVLSRAENKIDHSCTIYIIKVY